MTDAQEIVPGPGWEELPAQVKGQTVMVVGAPGTGKSRMALYLAAKLAGPRAAVGLINADVGQPALGVPTCLALSLGDPSERPRALWFVGDTTPSGKMLPAVVGTARLAQFARSEGARRVVIDTSGMVAGAPAHALKYHKALAARVESVVAVQKGDELEPLLELLAGICPMIHRLSVSPQARDRDGAERKAYRESCYAAHFQNGEPTGFDPQKLVGENWMCGPEQAQPTPQAGTVLGLLDERGTCLGLGIVDQFAPDKLLVYTPVKATKSVARILVSHIRVDRNAGFAETR